MKQVKRRFIVLFLFLPLGLFAQSTFECGFDSARANLVADTNWIIEEQWQMQPVYEQLTNPMIPQPGTSSGVLNKTSPDPQARLIIPVIVHVIHRTIDSLPGMVSNITDSQIYLQLHHLNEAYIGNTSDTNSINTGIQFCLASKDNQGNFTTGIVRKSSDSLTNLIITENNTTPEDSLFPEERYLNIYIVYKILTAPNKVSSIKGIGLRPLELDGDGIIMVYDWFGDVSNCNGCNLDSSSNGNVLVHEAGHYLGLYHTFQEGCNDSTQISCISHGDKCCDTPPVGTANRNCNQVYNSCQEENDQPDMLTNYMDYSLMCASTFSHDQTKLMHAFAVSYRKDLIEASNLMFS